jgi:tetratricopeptide (TPR) repeat protein
MRRALASLRSTVSKCLHRPVRSSVTVALVLLIGLNVASAGINAYGYYHLRSALRESNASHNLQAKDHLQACMKVWRTNPQCLLLAARTARRLGVFDDAERLLAEYQVVAGKENDDLYFERLLLRAERGEVDNVVPLCRRLIDADDPRSPSIFEALAHGYIRAYRHDEALAWVNRWAERQPEHIMQAYFRALVAELRNHLQEAAQGFERVLELDPEHDEARTHLTAVLIDIGQGHTAFPHVEYLLAKNPGNPQLQLSLAKCLDQMGDQHRAEATLDNLLAREPNFAEALTERGKIAYRNKDLKVAEQCLRQASLSQPGEFQVQYTLYLCLTELGKTEEAHTAETRWKQIEEDLTRINEIVSVKMQATPHDAGLHFEAGQISMRAGQTKEALRWFYSALKEDPQHAPTHRALADYYYRIGQFGRAARHREAAEKQNKLAPGSSPSTEGKPPAKS